MHTKLTESEKEFVQNRTNVTYEEMVEMKEHFDILPYEAHIITRSDLEDLRHLLPNLNIDLVKESQVKSYSGTCKCGRNLSLLDIVAFAVGDQKHNVNFLVNVLNGKMGPTVVVGYKDGHALTEDFKASMPANTIYVPNAKPVPCKDCGIEHEIIFFQEFIMHHWTNW